MAQQSRSLGKVRETNIVRRLPMLFPVNASTFLSEPN